MVSDAGRRVRRRDPRKATEEVCGTLRRPKVSLDERHEYEEWRRERGSRGRKRRDKAGGRHRYGRGNEGGWD
jgi:hypothetical protein